MKAGIARRYFNGSSPVLIGSLITSLVGRVVIVITGRLVGTALYCSYVLALILSNVIALFAGAATRLILLDSDSLIGLMH